LRRRWGASIIGAMPSRAPQHAAPFQPSPIERERIRKAYIDRARPPSSKRGYDSAWRKVRAEFLAAYPHCSAPGCQARATDVDHVLSVADRPDLRLSWSNLRPFCHSHHSARTARDQGFAKMNKK
jgi:5-methylcytosine-specific restriction protein A